MPFEPIERLGAPTTQPFTVPPMGVRVNCRKLGTRNGGSTSFINLRLGNQLAARLGLTGPEHAVELAFGSGNDAGKIAVMRAEGGFVAKGKPGKPYAIAINRASADGLFAEDFPAFERGPLEVVAPERGGPPMTVFAATAAMLAVED